MRVIRKMIENHFLCIVLRHCQPVDGNAYKRMLSALSVFLLHALGMINICWILGKEADYNQSKVLLP